MTDAPDLGPPLVLPLGDSGLLVRFADSLGDAANRAAIAFARVLQEQMPHGVIEVDPNLVSVLLTYDPAKTGFEALAGEVRLLIGASRNEIEAGREHRIAVRFGGEEGPDLDAAASALGLRPEEFIEQHNRLPLRVLATGFAPGFVYCGFHPEGLDIPRRADVRRSVPAGTVLLAARQTAIAATTVPTGWHVIGRTAFRNFNPANDPPTVLAAGDELRFEVQA